MIKSEATIKQNAIHVPDQQKKQEKEMISILPNLFVSSEEIFQIPEQIDHLKMPVFKFTDPLNPISEIELKHEVFGCDIRPDLLHRVVTWQRANKRQNTHFTKTKSTISGSNRKPWNQKGLGRARAGHKRSNIWIRGYKAHGPKEGRDFSQDLPKKIRKLGLCTALSTKYQTQNLIIVDEIRLESFKTKGLKQILNMWNFSSPVLIVDNDLLDTNFIRACNNIKEVNYIPQIGANVLDILKHKKLILTSSAVESLSNRLV